jgi:hypothetical protein
MSQRALATGAGGFIGHHTQGASPRPWLVPDALELREAGSAVKPASEVAVSVYESHVEWSRGSRSEAKTSLDICVASL